MRARNIKPGFFKNEILAELPFETRLLFVGLWMVADREGRFEDRPRRIAADVFPYDRELDIETGLTALEERGFIKRYAVAGLRLGLILNFKKHQSPHHTERASVFPPPAVADDGTTVRPLLARCGPAVNPLSRNGGNPPDSLFHRFSDSPKTDFLKQTSPSEQQNCSDQKPNRIPGVYLLNTTEICTPSKAQTTPKGTSTSPEAETLAELLKSEILRNKPDYRITQAQFRKWVVTADRMLRLDGRSENQIAELIHWAQHDEFWMGNILSMDRLREKFDQLEIKRQQGAAKSARRGKSSFAVSQPDYSGGLEGFTIEGDILNGDH